MRHTPSTHRNWISPAEPRSTAEMASFALIEAPSHPSLEEADYHEGRDEREHREDEREVEVDGPVEGLGENEERDRGDGPGQLEAQEPVHDRASHGDETARQEEREHGGTRPEPPPHPALTRRRAIAARGGGRPGAGGRRARRCRDRRPRRWCWATSPPPRPPGPAGPRRARHSPLRG